MADERFSEEICEKPKRYRKIPYYLVVIGAFLLLVGCVFISFRLYQGYGRARLEDYALGSPDTEALAEAIAPESGNTALKDGQVLYQGRIYEYNDELLTFLILGIDSKTGMSEAKRPGEAGQADMILLLVMDQEAKAIRLINISRDTIVNIRTFDPDGIPTGMVRGQLALQYAYGDGLDISGRLMEEAVSNLFYGIPIHGYGALEMTGIKMLNDEVGGVEVDVIEDLSFIFPDLSLGNRVLLLDDEALVYVQYRNIDADYSNELRVLRQKQYLSAYFGRVREKARDNITFPFQLYNKAKGYFSTSITVGQVAYLSTAILGLSLSDEDMHSVSGTIVKTDMYEEFHVTESDLFDLIISVFYKTALEN